MTTTTMTHAEVMRDLKHSVGEALRAKRGSQEARDSREYIHELGIVLCEMGGTKAMSDALYAVCNLLDDPHYGRAMAIMDHAFDGIGGWAA